ncbi:C45 family autoproteolytic acyltransferase/hydolase [Sorangium sp. So ce1024]|uniref:C45 family autoproteolytic acyltransferase/hydolase n=1 Tax=Sorangium sp. So ce1024 TaxID=3133327 RepID=UPI003EFF861A
MSGVVAIHAFSGAGYPLGHQHGARLGPQIRAFIADDLQRLNRILPVPVTLDALRPTLSAYHEAIARQLPRAIDEIRGLAEGAQIPYEQALLLQLRREIVGYRKVPSRGDCTTFARNDPAEAVLAQTVDLNGGLETEAYVMRVSNAGDDGRELLLLTFTGLLGYLGVNSHGLAIGLNLVMAGQWRPGVPGYMAIRHLLETATSVEDAVDRLDRLDLASSRSLTLCDAQSAATVEIVENVRRWRRGPELVHTNHLLDPELSPRDGINVFARNGSIARLSACAAALRALPAPAPESAYFSILDRDPICVPPDGDDRREATVARVVLRPRSRELFIKLGAHPSAEALAVRMSEAS